MNTVTSQRVRLGIGLAVTAVFVYLLLKNITFADLAAAATQLERTTLVIGLGFLLLEYGVRVVRWWLMLRACVPHIPLVACVRPLLVSVAVNNVVPLRAGDALRVIGFREQLKAPAAQLIGTVIIERLLDVTILLLFFLAGLAALSDTRAFPLYNQIAAVLGCTALLCWIFLLTAGQWLHHLVRWVCRNRSIAGGGWAQSAEKHVIQFTTALALIRTPQRAFQLLAMSVVVWSCNGAIFVTIAHGLGYDGAAAGPWFTLATATLSTLVPSSPGHVGTFDYFAASGLMAYGASRAMATLFAFLVHAVLWLPTTAAGTIYALFPASKLRGTPRTESP